MAVLAQVWDLTGSPVGTVAIGLATGLPMVLFGLLGGTLADAVDRRAVVRATTAGQVLAAHGAVCPSPGGQSQRVAARPGRHRHELQCSGSTRLAYLLGPAVAGRPGRGRSGADQHLLDPEQVAAMVAEYDAIDALVCNANIPPPFGTLAETSWPEFIDKVDRELAAAFHASQRVLEVMRQRQAGRIDHVSSLSAEVISAVVSGAFGAVTGATIPVDGGFRLLAP